MSIIPEYVNGIQSRHGVAPKPDPTLRAFVAAWLLHNGLLGVSTVAQAVILADSSRPSVEAALTILKSEDEVLVARVLTGFVSLLNAAAQVKRRADLIASFRSAWPEDREAFAAAVGVDELFDSAIAPLLDVAPKIVPAPKVTPAPKIVTVPMCDAAE